MPKPLLCNPKPFKDQFKRDKGRKERRYCFVLGAGASVSSGIPSGVALAGQWLRELHERQCPQPKTGREALSLEEWCKTADCPVAGVDPKKAGAYYPQLFLARYPNGDPEGQRFIQEAIRGINGAAPNLPSIGYAYLALILQQTDSRIVITTNFDNLAADALLLLTGSLPRVVGHERVAAFAGLRDGQPLIAKIHGDVGFITTNDPDGVSKLHSDWALPLREILRDHIPVFIGYDGNDGSLMDFLCEKLFESDGEKRSLLRSGLYWCFRAGENREWHARVEENPRLKRLTEIHQVHFVPIGDFDLWMMELGIACEVGDPEVILRRNLEHRVKILSEQLNKARVDQALPAPNSAVEVSRAETRGEIGKKFSQWDLVYRALAEKDHARADRLFQDAIGIAPNDAGILGNYAIFLSDHLKDPVRGQEMYERALKADPNHDANLGNYAIFLKTKLKDYNRAQEIYERALKANATHANTLGSYANFLTDIRKEHDRAQQMYERALKSDPNHADTLGNYAVFLKNVRRDYDKAEEMYERALKANDNHANNLGNYANFLTDIRKAHDRAQELYDRAIKSNANHANALFCYALFLTDIRNDYDRAQKMYDRALKADPENATILSNYATFLKNIRKDYSQAQGLYEKAIKASPENVVITGIYANFLADNLQNYDRAQELYEQALAADPNQAANLGNYANFLTNIRKDHARAKELYERAMKIDPDGLFALGNYSGFLLKQGDDNHGLPMLNRAISLLPKNAPTALDLELWYYTFAHGPADNRVDALGKLKRLILDAKLRTPGWDLSGNIERATNAGHPDSAWLPKLAGVLNGEAKPDTLQPWDAWQKA